MSTTENTSTIDEKKNEETEGKTDFKAFAYNYIQSIVFTIGISIFIIGGLGLYTTKVAQSNILPDDIDLAPYTVFDRVVNDIPIDMNIMRPTFWSDNKDTVSQKVKFNSQEYLDSFNNSFLCSIKKAADPNSGLFANAPLFFSSVYDNIVAKNFLAINTIFFYLSYLPESIIMLVYGFFGIFLWFTLYLFNICISIFYHFINIPQLFREAPENSKQWEAHDNISFFRIGKILLFFFIWVPIALLSTFVVPIFFTLYGLISPLFASYKIQKSEKSNGIIDFIKNNFAYKKLFFFILATISLISNGTKYLGSKSLIGIVVAIGFAYFMGLYDNEIPNAGINGFSAKIRQNMKQSSIDFSYDKLVEICKPIPVIDTELDSKISGKQYRKVTKPKNVEGDIDDDFDVSPPIINVPFESASVPPISSLKQDLENYKSQLELLNDDLGRGAVSGPEIMTEKANLEKNIADTEALLNSGQTGGKKVKNRYINNTKKYNIRLV